MGNFNHNGVFNHESSILFNQYLFVFTGAIFGAGISGRYDLTNSIGVYKDLLNGYHNKKNYFNMPIQYLTNLEDATLLRQLRQMEVVLAVGEVDPFLFANRQLSSLLCEKGIRNEFHTWESDAHRPYFWRKMAPIYI